MIGTWPMRSGANGSGQPEPRAIIDIGSNTVRLVIYGGAPRAPRVLFNEKVVAQLGLGVALDGRLSGESMELAHRALARFALILRDANIRNVHTVATAAVREAINRDEFMQLLEGLNLRPSILSGEEEARMSALGVIGAFPSGEGIVADLGGGSLELVRIADGATEGGISLPLGTLRLAEARHQRGGDLRKTVTQSLKQWDGGTAQTLYLVGGTWRALATFALEQDQHPLSDPHGIVLSAKEARSLTERLLTLAPDRISDVDRVSSMRAVKLPDAAVLLQALLKRTAAERLVFSSWGLREGVLFSALPPLVRAQDPLLAGIAAFGQDHGIAPTLAAQVAGWTAGAIPAQHRGQERLRLAATTLALASMRIEPNLRNNQAVEWALYKRWITTTATERALLAAAICGNGNCAMPDEIALLATPEQLDGAYAWGLAIRLCRRLGAGSPQSLEASRLSIDGGRLLLTVAENHRALVGQPTEKDLRLLAARLRLDRALEFSPAAGGERVEQLAQNEAV